MILKIGENGLKQIIYVPVRSKKDLGVNIIEGENYSFHFDYVLNKSDKILYSRKINKTFKSLENKVQLTDVNICHAHTLFSDGGIALVLKKKYNIPYIVSVRNTDLFIFFKYLIHLRRKGREILINASKVIFTNFDYKNILVNKYLPKKLKESINVQVIPNGIDDFWIKNKAEPKEFIGRANLSILYVGTFMKNKNVALLVDTIIIFANRNKNYNITLNLVGGGGRAGQGKGDKKVYDKIQNSEDCSNLNVNFHGRINDLKILKNHYYNNDIFVMISKKENFGLSFIEALSQGTPIIYTNGQGVSSFFKKEIVGCGIDKFDSKEIILKLTNVLKNYNAMSQNAISSINRFQWKNIVNNYCIIYDSILNNSEF